MKINKNTRIVGKKVTLIPYLKKHVPTYHQWMQNPEILKLTASEPLSLQEEYEMQESWHNDPEKLTFLLIDRETDTLCGDVNLFVQPDFDDTGLNIAELEVMIAEEKSRRKGIAEEALRIMMLYAVKRLDMQLYVVHILEENQKSKVLFEQKLGFKVDKFQEWSNEWILQLRVTDEWEERMDKELDYIQEEWNEWDGEEEDDGEEGEDAGEEGGQGEQNELSDKERPTEDR